MSLKIKAKGEDARELMDMKASFKAGGKPMMKENPASRNAEGDNGGPEHAKDYMDSQPSNVMEENVQQGYTIVKPVNSVMPEHYPESARRKNNQARDQRTNLGRGKAGIVEVEG